MGKTTTIAVDAEVKRQWQAHLNQSVVTRATYLLALDTTDVGSLETLDRMGLLTFRDSTPDLEDPSFMTQLQALARKLGYQLDRSFVFFIISLLKDEAEKRRGETTEHQ